MPVYCKLLRIFLISNVSVLHYCSIDATNSSGLGRMVNDSKAGNCVMRKVMVDGVPHLCLFARTNIAVDEQLMYDYGDDSEHLFWRKKVTNNTSQLENINSDSNIPTTLAHCIAM